MTHFFPTRRFSYLPKGKLCVLLAGLGFMLPGFVLMFALSWLYLSTGIMQTVAATAAFLGVQPAVIALIVRAVHRIGGHILLDRWLWGIAAVAGLAALVGPPLWLTLPIAGLAYVFAARHQPFPARLLLALPGGLRRYFACFMLAGYLGGRSSAPH